MNKSIFMMIALLLVGGIAHADSSDDPALSKYNASVSPSTSGSSCPFVNGSSAALDTNTSVSDSGSSSSSASGGSVDK